MGISPRPTIDSLDDSPLLGPDDTASLLVDDSPLVDPKGCRAAPSSWLKIDQAVTEQIVKSPLMKPEPTSSGNSTPPQMPRGLTVAPGMKPESSPMFGAQPAPATWFTQPDPQNRFQHSNIGQTESFQDLVQKMTNAVNQPQVSAQQAYRLGMSDAQAVYQAQINQLLAEATRGTPETMNFLAGPDLPPTIGSPYAPPPMSMMGPPLKKQKLNFKIKIERDTLDLARMAAERSARRVPIKGRRKASVHRGVSWDSTSKRWVARIMVTGTRVKLGTFAEEDKAAAAYQAAQRARTNGTIDEHIQQLKADRVRRRPKASSSHRGVSWYKANKKWEARITVSRRTVRLGYFDREDVAAKAYKDARAAAQAGVFDQYIQELRTRSRGVKSMVGTPRASSDSLRMPRIPPPVIGSDWMFGLPPSVDIKTEVKP